METVNSQTVSENEILVVRIFDAPREVVWAAWCDPEHLKNWWGPDGFTNTFEEFDFHPGGNWRFTMHAPNGMSFHNHNQFVEIDEPERIVIDHLVTPLFRIVATFEEVDGRTRMTFRQTFDTRETFDRVKHFAVPGTGQTIEKLAHYLLESTVRQRTAKGLER
jgi:uncharacterized protein YndB with AHSA1/START domain